MRFQGTLIVLPCLALILFAGPTFSRDLAGIRGVQIRSGQVVTVWLGYLATTDSSKLYDKSLYKVVSPNDSDYKEAVHPVSISRFSKGSRSAGGPHEIHGGHHDTGDYDTHLTHFVVSEKLMTLFEMLPEKFYDGQSRIPEQNNGIPDIIDEAMWRVASTWSMNNKPTCSWQRAF